MGAFAQYDWHIGDKTTLQGGLRIDHQNRYGVFVLPQAALFHRFNQQWGMRAGFGMGYKTPDPLQQPVTDNATSALPLLGSNLEAERSYGGNAEVNYSKKWDAGHSIFINQAFFYTQLQDPLFFQMNADSTQTLINAAMPVTSLGFDSYVKLTLEDWEIYLGYTYTDARREYDPVVTNMPLTPRNRAAMVLAREFGKKCRIGFEGSYVGYQYRFDGSTTPDYLFLAAMVQYSPVKHISLVLNGENLLDYRMSKVESIYGGTISTPTFKPLWAPIDGRVINLSVRWTM